MDEPAHVFEDRQSPGDWRVEKIVDDGGVEVAIFGGPNARQRAIQYADWRYRELLAEISLEPMRCQLGGDQPYCIRVALALRTKTVNSENGIVK